MSNYYDEKLNSQMLFQVYETAIPRISQYLNAEIDYKELKASQVQALVSKVVHKTTLSKAPTMVQTMFKMPTLRRSNETNK